MLTRPGLSTVNLPEPTTTSTLFHRTGSSASRGANSSAKRPARCSTSRTSRGSDLEEHRRRRVGMSNEPRRRDLRRLEELYEELKVKGSLAADYASLGIHDPL